MIVRELETTDRDALHAFFLSLSDETITQFNRFNGRLGPVNREPAARAMADLQTSLISREPDEEQGWVAVENFSFRDASGQSGAVYSEIVGYGFLRFSPHRPTQKWTCSLGIVVKDEYQHHGVGSMLMAVMLTEAKKRGMRKIYLQCYSDNFAAIKLYRSCGFQLEAVFKKQEWLDDVPLEVDSWALFLR